MQLIKWEATEEEGLPAFQILELVTDEQFMMIMKSVSRRVCHVLPSGCVWQFQPEEVTILKEDVGQLYVDAFQLISEAKHIGPFSLVEVLSGEEYKV